MKNLATALVKAQQAFQPALKTTLNPHFRTMYADLSACIQAVIGALNANDIYLLQKSYDCTEGVMIETVFIHSSGEMLETGIVHFPATKKDPQGYASALTYARRNSLLAACGIAPEDDDGNSSSAPEKPTLTDKRLSDAVARIKEGKYTTVQLREQFALTKEQNDFVTKALANA